MANPRGFFDALAPVRQRAQWRLDEALAQLTVLRAQDSAARSELDALERQANDQSMHAADAWRSRVDPASQIRALEFLASVHASQSRTRLRIAALDQQVNAARDECVKRQARLESFQIHRDEALQLFSREQQRKESAHADDDWLMRGQAMQPEFRS